MIISLQLLQHWLGIEGRLVHNTRDGVEFSSCGFVVIASSGGDSGGGGEIYSYSVRCLRRLWLEPRFIYADFWMYMGGIKTSFRVIR